MLRFLRGVGIPVGTIIDVGAREETLELRQAFPDLRHILFEPASEFHDALRTNYASMDYVLVPAALSQEGRGYLRTIAIDGNKISHSWLVDEASNEALVAFYNKRGTCEQSIKEELVDKIWRKSPSSIESFQWLIDGGKVPSVRFLPLVTTMRLDSFMSTRDDAKPYLLKLDVDGLEIPIMQGSEGIWDDVSCVIVEATIASFAERMNFLLAKGFKLFDIVDHCYYYGMFSQVDLGL
jgi:FkbM family methyltransferase